ncbi:U1 small nuclear ribonucleoprotein 24 kDa [Trypanosoma cruzi]|nr:U1 small nuclear ribonucleoprotein 24 kDa [Trypanosoma cruzi]
MYQPIGREELERYLPNFDPMRDPQVGEWVLVSPHRRVTLLRPFVQMAVDRGLQPNYPFLVANTLTDGASSPSVLTTMEPKWSAQVDPRRIFPTLEEVCRKYRRRRVRNTKPAMFNNKTNNIHDVNTEDGDEEDDDTTLYLNVRALLLTPCAPAVFGGSDFIEGIDKETGRVVFLNWKTGEVRTDTAALKPRPIPEWAEEVVEKAIMEWENWQREEKKALQPRETDCDAPPLQRARNE